MIFKKFETVISVDGMHCQKCVARITTALKAIENVKKVSVSLESKEVSVISKSEISKDEIKQAIEKLGFKAV